MSGGPGGLEVEAAGDAIDIEDLAGEVEAGDGLALHRFELDVIERDATAGYEFVFIKAFTGDLKFGAHQFLDEAVGLGAGEIGPRGIVFDSGSEAHVLPKAAGDALNEAAFHHFPNSMVSADCGELIGQGLGRFA